MRRKYSVIIPVYNSESTLNKCVDSVLGQTYSNFELILVDDGSRDQSGQIIDEYAHKDNRVIAVHKENGGVSSARNKGIDIATGDYIAFIDSDDWIDSNYLESFNSSDADCIVSGFKLIENGIFKESFSLNNLIYNGNEIANFCINNINLSLLVPWSKAFRRFLISEHSLKFDCDINFGEDTLFNFEFISQAATLQSISACAYHYWYFNTKKPYRVTVDQFLNYMLKFGKVVGKLFRSDRNQYRKMMNVESTLQYSACYNYVLMLPMKDRFCEVLKFLINRSWRNLPDEGWYYRFKKTIEFSKLLFR